MRIVIAAVVLLLGLTTACGDGTKRLTAGDEPGTQVDVCVDDHYDYDYTKDPERVGEKQAALRDDQDVVRRYGEAHPEDFTLVGFDNHPPVKVIGVFTEHLEQHHAAIVSQLEHPDRFEVRRGVLTHDVAEAIQEELSQEPYKGNWTSNGIAGLNGRVTVNFKGTQPARDAAAKAHETWSRAVCIEVAGHPFPKGAWPDTAKCPTDPAATERNPAVEFKLILDKTTLSRGEDGTGTARITNHGSTAITLETGEDIDANVTLPGSNQIVAYETGFETLAGRSSRIEPGKSDELPVRFGTEDCAPNSDYSLPPGEYVVSSYLKEVGRSDDVTITIVE